ncbi:hypothetical protein D9758_018047 [Tetrapyrgos nigripes]|uniref:RRM domain-containing protein n=1 Tax=Tetrapyrgos nigripes TaxID=182062 RepID=A0A8H5B7H0_9AGAR|nr:hypothetical protein D9758_018047 [Tetrapyrgos nigripes]
MLPIESVIKHPDRQVEIRYLEARAADYVRHLAGKRPGLELNGQFFQVKLVGQHRLPIEVIAAIGLRAASRTLVLQNIRENYTAEELEEEMRRFGEVDRVLMDPSGRGATVDFCRLITASQALKTLCKEDWDVAFRTLIPRPEDPRNDHLTVLLGNLKSTSLQGLLRDLGSLLQFHNGDPMSVRMFEKCAFLTFSNAENAREFFNNYKKPKGIIKDWASKIRIKNLHHRAAVKLGASRELRLDGFTDKRVDFARLHQDFSKFGEIYYVFRDWKKDHARIVFTDVISALKAVEDIYENRSNYSVYSGARVTFGHPPAPKGRLHRWHLRPLLIPNIHEDGLFTTGNVDEGDDWEYAEDVYDDSDKVNWIWRERQIPGTDKYRLDVSPPRNPFDPLIDISLMPGTEP